MPMTPLIDGDILVYECAFAGENRETGDVHSFDYVAALFDEKVYQICSAVYATEDPEIYLTGSNNFRFDIAVTQPYKDRSAPKPFHYANLRAYAASLRNCFVHEGLEADDLLSIRQYGRWRSRDTIICSRDKDLRICPGLHYGWEAGGQPEFFPRFIDEIGYLEVERKVKDGKEYIDKVKGGGLKFFYAQLLMGDPVDNIPGCPQAGKAKAALLQDLQTEKELFNFVSEVYRQKIKDGWKERMLEQARLLWLIREFDQEGNPVMWEFPCETA